MNLILSLPARVAAFFALIALSALTLPAHAMDGRWQCVTFAQSYSGIQIRGNAHRWWDQAAGLYARSQRPQIGAVLVMKSFGSGGMRLGHVATVSQIVSDREILLTHANWLGDGRVERNVRAQDVSPAGDWSQVRVWYAPINAMGRTAFPAYGFILPDKNPRTTAPFEMAMKETISALRESAGGGS